MEISKEKFLEKKRSLKGISSIRIISGSMSPLIEVYDNIIIEPIVPNDLNPYDIIVFWQDDKLICHFFIKKENNLFITKGLRSKKYDNPIKEEELFARCIKPKVGRFKKFFLKFFMR